MINLVKVKRILYKVRFAMLSSVLTYRIRTYYRAHEHDCVVEVLFDEENEGSINRDKVWPIVAVLTTVSPISTTVTVAASVPFSLTAIYVLCNTSDI